ncbi:MAG: molybdenum cofactor biosynthesis protein MoaE [Coriobacteriales bacterium]
MKKESPSMDAWLKEAKADPSAPKVGMYLVHNGCVREIAREVVREGSGNMAPVTGMSFSYDQAGVDAAIERVRAYEGIEYIRVWLNEGELEVGDDIMYVMIGGDIRPRVINALQDLVGEIKTNCVSEVEKR